MIRPFLNTHLFGQHFSHFVSPFFAQENPFAPAPNGVLFLSYQGFISRLSTRVVWSCFRYKFTHPGHTNLILSRSWSSDGFIHWEIFITFERGFCDQLRGDAPADPDCAPFSPHSRKS